MLRFLPLLLLAACAASGPSEYRDGARLPPPEPRTTYTPAGAGLPEYFVPPEPAYPRSPHSRELPPTKEPGLWSGDGPSAAKGPTAKPVLLGVELPLPPGPDDTPGPGPARIC